MPSPDQTADDLDEIRREIDAIDTRLLALVSERFDATGRVRAIKSGNGSIGVSPLRPAREAAILRRLVEAEAPHLPASLKVRLWRAILAASSLNQAKFAVHISGSAINSGELRVLIAERFGTAALVSHGTEALVLEAVANAAGDVAVVAAESDWARGFADGRCGKARVIGVAPDLSDGGAPKALVIGHAAAEATGADETLVVSDGQLPRDFAIAPLWQVKSGNLRVSSLPGFLDEHSPPVAGILRANTGLRLQLAGRYPSPIETGA